MKSKVEKYIPGVFGHAVYRNGEWTVYGGQSAQTFEDEFVFCIDEDLLEELQDDDPVYASVGYFEDSEKEGETLLYTTKRELLDASRKLLEREGIPVTKANIYHLAKDALLDRLFDIEWYGQGSAPRIFSQLPTVVQSETTMMLTYTDIGVDEGFIEKGKVQYVFRNGRFVVDKILMQQDVPYTLENLCATGYSEAEPVVSNEDLDVIINQFRNEYGERQVPMPLQWTPEQLLQLKQFIQQNEFLHGLWPYNPDDGLPWIADFMDETFKDALEVEHE